MRRISVAVLAGCVLVVSRTSAGDPPPTSGRAWIKSHRISARFEPATHRIIATDVLDFDTTDGRRVALRDPGTIRASSPEFTKSDEAGMSLAMLPDGVDRITITYEKLLADAVPAKGFVSEQGIRLTGATDWYPTDVDTAPHLARFDVTTYVPEPFLVVTQGRVPERSCVLAPKGWTSETVVVPPTAKAGEETAAYAVSSVLAQLPTRDLALAAGPYEVTTRTIEGIEASTYFLEGEADAAPQWLDAIGDEITRYESRLGTYPHAKFDLVETGLPTNGAGPSLAFLDRDRIRSLLAATAAFASTPTRDELARAYVGGWFGGALFADPAGRNWADPLAAYLATHAAREPASRDAGREARRAALVPAARHTPGEGRADAADLLVFHALRRRLGDDEFFAGLKRLAADRVGTYVSWKDVLAALDGEWAHLLVERRDLPTLRVVAASRWPGPKRSLNSDVRIEVVAELAPGAEPWPPIDVPFSIDDKSAGTVTVTNGSGVWMGNVGGLPKTVELDPDYDILRALGGPEDTRRDIAPGGRPALDVLDTLHTLAADGTAGVPSPERFLASKLESLLGVKAVPFPGGAPADASGVADLTSSRDLTITTATETIVLKDAFRPICSSPPRAKGESLEFGEGDHPVPLPGRIPDTSIEGLERFWRQIEMGVAPALLLLPNPTARKALASLVDAPNALTAEAEAELAVPGPDGAARPRPALGPWIAERRANAFPGLRPLRIPVLLITDEAYEKIFDLKDVRTIDFEVSFGPAIADGPATNAPTALVATWMPPGLPAERPPVVIVSVRVGGPGQGDDASTGVACVLGALEEWASTADGAKRGLVVCFFQGKFAVDPIQSLSTDFSKRFDVRAMIDLGPVGLLRNDEVSVAAFRPDAELRSLAGKSLPTAGLRMAPNTRWDAVLADAPACFAEAGVRPVVTLRASPRPTSLRDLGRREPPIDPTGVARVSVAVRELLRRLLTAP